WGTARRCIACIKILNEILQGDLIYELRRFASVNLRPDTRRAVEIVASDRSRRAANRMLLEDAFPREIKRGAYVGFYERLSKIRYDPDAGFNLDRDEVCDGKNDHPLWSYGEMRKEIIARGGPSFGVQRLRKAAQRLKLTGDSN